MEKVIAILGLFMSLFFIAMGVLVQLYPPVGFEALSPFIKYLASAVLILYGLFRLYRSSRLLKAKR